MLTDELIQAGLNMLSQGFTPIPSLENKAPVVEWTDIKKDGITADKFIEYSRKYYAVNIGFITGSPSKNIECLDFDLKYAENPGELYGKFCSIIEAECPSILNKITVVKTKNNGFHWYYSVPLNYGSTHLAKRFVPEKNGVRAIIETRGEGAYAVTFPSKGYDLIFGSFDCINQLTEEEHSFLLEIGRSFNEYTKDEYIPKGGANKKEGNTPLNDFNERGDAMSMIEEHGWRLVRRRGNKFYYVRPGKDPRDGCSAEWDDDKRYFYVFTTSDGYLNGNRSYTCSQLKAYLEHNGDFEATARVLGARGYGQQNQPKAPKPSAKIESVFTPSQEFSDAEPTTNSNAAEFWAKELFKNRIDHTSNISDPPAVIRVDGIDICTRGNISAIIGPAKARKTFMASLFIAAATGNLFSNRLTGVVLPGKDASCLIDTEQHKGSTKKVHDRILRLSDSNNLNDALYIFNIREYGTDDSLQMVERALQLIPNLSFMMIDGISDICEDSNDNKISKDLVKLLMRWSTIYDCHICVVLHDTKASTRGRGHLGSELERKCETVFRLEKDISNPQYSVLTAQYSRGREMKELVFSVNNEGLPVVDENEISILNKDGKRDGPAPHTFDIDYHLDLLRDLFKYGPIEGRQVLEKSLKEALLSKSLSLGNNSVKIWTTYYLEVSKMINKEAIPTGKKGGQTQRYYLNNESKTLPRSDEF